MIHNWSEFNNLLTNKITSWLVSMYAAVVGTKGIVLGYTHEATSVLGLISLLIAIVVGYLTIKNLRLKNKILMQHLEEGNTAQLKESVLKDLHK